MNGKIACLIIAVLSTAATSQIGRTDFTGIPEQVPLRDRIVPTTSTILTIRSDGTVERRGKPLEYVERDELIVIIGELLEHIQKGNR